VEKYCDITRRILGRLPYWFKMRHNPDSLGAQFLNCFGLELKDVEHVLKYALEQLSLQTVDVGQADICYRGSLPGTVTPDMTLSLASGSVVLRPAASLREFFVGFAAGASDRALVLQNPYYVDWERMLVYTRYPYSKSGDYPEGKIDCKITLNNQPIADIAISLRLYHVWNFLDEFGLILNTPRLYGEANDIYKERLIGVFRFPGGAHARGMLNSIARGLLLTRRVHWKDGSVDLLLHQAKINIETIMIDGQPVAAKDFATDRDGRVLIKGSPFLKDIGRYVSYAFGVEMHALGDEDFKYELFTEDGEPQDRLQHYMKAVEELVPTMWGKFIWGQGAWNPLQNNTACIPSFMDASVAGWEQYESR
jgi:hypothetical protein